VGDVLPKAHTKSQVVSHADSPDKFSRIGVAERMIPRDVEGRAIRQDRDGCSCSQSIQKRHSSLEPFPVFIGGVAHSGTTFLDVFLTSIPGVSSASNFRHKREVRIDSVDSLQRLQLATHGTVTIFKNPDVVFSMPMVLEAWPNARFIVMYRDGRDVASSILRRSPSWGNTPKKVAEYYVDAIRSSQSACTRGGASCRFVKYEDLVDERTRRRTVCGLMEFLSTATDYDACDVLRAHAKKFQNNTSGQGTIPSDAHHNARRIWQIRQPMYDGRGQWQQDKDSLQTLKSDTGFLEVMVELGYLRSVNDTNW